MSAGWRLFYAVVILIAILATTAIISWNNHLSLQYIWYFSFGLLFSTCGIAIQQVSQEFRNGTSGWWLSLPYSRLTLVLAKTGREYGSSHSVIAIAFGLAIIWGFYATILAHLSLSHDFMMFAFSGLKWFITIIAFIPFVTGFGTMMAVIAKTKARPILPLLWVLI